MKKYYYTLYSYDAFTNDFVYLREYKTQEEIQQNEKICLTTIKEHLQNKIFNTNNKLINNKLLIIQEKAN